MIAAMAQWEREEIADRVSAAITVRAKLGKPLNGKAPFGYVWKDKKLAPDPAEAPIRKLMYELFAQYRRKKTVARTLNERGYRTRDDCQWSDTSVGRLIADPTAKGLHRANYTKRVAANKPWVQKPESEWVWGKVEPIVPEALWEQCNHILAEQRAKPKRPGKRPVHLFAGLTFCHCGRKMYVPSNTPKYVCQGSHNKIPVADLEGIFYEQLRGFFVSPEQILAHMGQADQNLKNKEGLLATLERELAKVGEEVQRIYRLYSDGGLTADGFGKFYRPLEARQKELDEEVPRLQAEVDILKVNCLSGDQVLVEAKDLYGRWPKLTKEEKQSIVASITEKIVIGKGEIAISLCYLPSSENMTKEQRRL
jgi:site-specific DNA recombinase